MPSEELLRTKKIKSEENQLDRHSRRTEALSYIGFYVDSPPNLVYRRKTNNYSAIKISKFLFDQELCEIPPKCKIMDIDLGVFV